MTLFHSQRCGCCTEEGIGSIGAERSCWEKQATQGLFLAQVWCDVTTIFSNVTSKEMFEKVVQIFSSGNSFLGSGMSMRKSTIACWILLDFQCSTSKWRVRQSAERWVGWDCSWLKVWLLAKLLLKSNLSPWTCWNLDSCQTLPAADMHQDEVVNSKSHLAMSKVLLDLEIVTIPFECGHPAVK